jgi:DNA-binding MarR family transcriptional regulator
MVRAGPPVASPSVPDVTSPTRPRPGDDWRFAVWRAFLRANAVVIAALERELMTEAALPLAWYDVLVQLAEAPERRLRMAELADRVLLSRSGLSRLVDRLVTEGLVRREPSPDDARGTYTVLTVAGVDRLRAAAPTHLAGVQRHWLSRFSDPELAQLGELLGRLDPAD